MVVFFFFFKQKTAYEIGTGDWSSDVCSSDLGGADGRVFGDYSADAGSTGSAEARTYFGTGINKPLTDRKSVV